MSLAPLRTVLVGCGPMGRGHGRTVAALEDYALPGFELLMAIHESARLVRRVDLPLQQDRY
ncbi:MAG: hypothetical protein HYU66_03505, partial [Armatimonadetes bacterium]|nr:hypothetical protein [Armatimonadota bacterium]